MRQLVALTEELTSKVILDKGNKAQLPRELMREIEKDMSWAEGSKKMVEAGAAELFAKYLNESQVPLEVRPWVMISIGSLQIGIGFTKSLKKLDQIIAQNDQILKQQAQQPGPPSAKTA